MQSSNLIPQLYLMIRKAGRARPAHDLLPEPQISKAQNER